MREKTTDTQIDIFTQDTFIYRSILTNDWDDTEKQIIARIIHKPPFFLVNF